MSDYGWKSYLSVGERQKKAENAAAKAKKAGKVYAPIAPYRGALAKTVWGKAWCDNLQAYSDYANRLPRGASYVRNGSVIDLQLSAGNVAALVMGSSLYKVNITVEPVEPTRWKSVCKDCSGSIASLVEILQGKLSSAVMQRICEPGKGLMPSPKDIRLDCDCPDWAGVCKHIAAVLYGVGARLDQQPELLFTLRHVDAKDLVQAAGAGLASAQKAPKTARVLEDALLDDVFGLDMAQEVASVEPLPRLKTAAKSFAKAPAAKKVAAKKAVAKKVATKKVAANKATAKKIVANKLAVKKIETKKWVPEKVAGKQLVAKLVAPHLRGQPKSTPAKAAAAVKLLKK